MFIYLYIYIYIYMVGCGKFEVLCTATICWKLDKHEVDII